MKNEPMPMPLAIAVATGESLIASSLQANRTGQWSWRKSMHRLFLSKTPTAAPAHDACLHGQRDVDDRANLHDSSLGRVLSPWVLQKRPCLPPKQFGCDRVQSRHRGRHGFSLKNGWASSAQRLPSVALGVLLGVPCSPKTRPVGHGNVTYGRF